MKWDDLITSQFQRLMQDLDWKTKVMKDLDWKTKVMQDLDWKSKLFPNSGIFAAMEEQRQISERMYPYMALQDRLAGMDKLSSHLDLIKSVTSLAQPAFEDYKLAYTKDIFAMPESLKSLIGPSRYLDSINNSLLGITKLENSYKAALDPLNIPYTLPSERIINSFANVAAVCDTFKLGQAYAGLSLYNSVPYANFVSKQLTCIERDVPLIASRRAIVTELSGKLYETAELAAEVLFDSSGRDFAGDELYDADQHANVFGRANSYLAYAYNPNNDIEIGNSFEKAIPVQICQLGCHIVEKIYSLNDFNLKKGKHAIFKVTNKSIIAASKLPTTIANNEFIFAQIVDFLYFLLYEGSGGGSSENRLVEVTGRDALTPLWWIKFLRNDFRHDLGHGEPKNVADKLQRTGNVYASLIGRERPYSSREWVEAQLALYGLIHTMLEGIIPKL